MRHVQKGGTQEEEGATQENPLIMSEGNKGKGIPAMATIEATITADGTTLRLAAEGCEPLEVETTAGPGATRRECTLFTSCDIWSWWSS